MQIIPAWLWRDGIDYEAVTPWQKALRYPLRLTLGIVQDILRGQHGLYAASLVYTTLLALAPLLALSFSVVKSLGGANMLEPFLRETLAPLGAQGTEIINRIIEFVNNINVGVLGAVGLAFLIVSVLSLMQKIEDAFNHIWRVAEPRQFVSRVRDHLSVLMVGPLFIFLSMGMTATLRYEDALSQWLGIETLDMAVAQVLSLVPFLLYTLAFAAFYLFMPNCRVRVLPALAAGLFTALAWKGLGYAFSLFVAQSGNYAAIYSAFAALVIFMLWLYLAWLIVLAGATLSYYLQNPDSLQIEKRYGPPPAAHERAVALLLAADLSRRFYAGGALSARQAATAWHLPLPQVVSALEALERAGLVVETPREGYVPARPFDQLTVADFVILVDCGGAAASPFAVFPGSIETIAAEIRSSWEGALGGMTLKDLGEKLAADLAAPGAEAVR